MLHKQTTRKHRRTLRERIDELNAILGKDPKYHFVLLSGHRNFRVPYCLAHNSCAAAELSLPFRELKALAAHLRDWREGKIDVDPIYTLKSKD